MKDSKFVAGAFAIAIVIWVVGVALSLGITFGLVYALLVLIGVA